MLLIHLYLCSPHFFITESPSLVSKMFCFHDRRSKVYCCFSRVFSYSFLPPSPWMSLISFLSFLSEEGLQTFFIMQFRKKSRENRLMSKKRRENRCDCSQCLDFLFVASYSREAFLFHDISWENKKTSEKYFYLIPVSSSWLEIRSVFPFSSLHHFIHNREERTKFWAFCLKQLRVFDTCFSRNSSNLVIPRRRSCVSLSISEYTQDTHIKQHTRRKLGSILRESVFFASDSSLSWETRRCYSHFSTCFSVFFWCLLLHGMCIISLSFCFILIPQSHLLPFPCYASW
jgi:hypothetical protein